MLYKLVLWPLDHLPLHYIGILLPDFGILDDFSKASDFTSGFIPKQFVIEISVFRGWQTRL